MAPAARVSELQVERETERQGYEGLQKKLKEVFSERSGILQQLSKTSKELDSIKGNLQMPNPFSFQG
ncbi:unnamed protein product [Boreogadus saida]